MKIGNIVQLIPIRVMLYVLRRIQPNLIIAYPWGL